jgi:hypothetical protein
MNAPAPQPASNQFDAGIAKSPSSDSSRTGAGRFRSGDFSRPTGPNSFGTWLAITLAVAILARLGLLFGYQPVLYGDSPSYRRLAAAVLRGFERYDGTRTPGYPAFLALVGPDERVWWVQMGLGILITLLLFYIGWRLSGKAWFAGLAAFAYTLNLGQLFFEANLLTETLTTFWIILTLAGMLIYLYDLPLHSGWLAFGIGLCTALALITRPLFIYLPFFALLFIVLVGLKPGTFKLSNLQTLPFRPMLSFLLPVILIADGWVTFIHSRYGDWSLTTMTGYHLVQHTGSFFEYVPDEYAVLRDTYIRYRDAHIAEYGDQTNTIWEAIPELTKVSGLHFYDLSRTLARISVRLILEHPDLYLHNVLEGWWLFWRAPAYWSPAALRWPALVAPIQTLVQVERVLLFGANLWFIVTSLVWMLGQLGAAIRKIPPANRAQDLLLWYLTGSIWLASIIQSLLDHGDNPRFLVPLQSLVVLWGLWFASNRLRKAFHRRDAEKTL